MNNSNKILIQEVALVNMVMNYLFHKQKGEEAVYISRCKQLYTYKEISPKEGGL
jgi:hypothetical protein